jgi:hypothetical protein
MARLTFIEDDLASLERAHGRRFRQQAEVNSRVRHVPSHLSTRIDRRKFTSKGRPVVIGYDNLTMTWQPR